MNHNKICISKQYIGVLLFITVITLILYFLSVRVNKQRNIVESKAAPKTIIGGQDAVEGEFPYFTVILNTDSQYWPQCGAALISEDWAITAAHCVYDFDKSAYINIGVIVGLNRFDSKFKALHFSLIDKIVVFDPSAKNKINLLQNNIRERYLQDIALIHLSSPAKDVPTVSFLGSNQKSQINKLIGTEGKTIGFGITRFTLTNTISEKQPSYILKKATTILESYNFDNNYYILKSTKNLVRADLGDSGGPLIYSINGIPYIIGITSEGDGNLPDGNVYFTSVHDYAIWIKKITTIKPNSGSAKIFDSNVSLSPTTHPMTICTDMKKQTECDKRYYLCGWVLNTASCINFAKYRW